MTPNARKIERLTTQLAALRGAEKAAAIIADSLKRTGLTSVETPDQLLAVCDALVQLGGIEALVARSMRAEALAAGAKSTPKVLPVQMEIRAAKDIAAASQAVADLAVKSGFPNTTVKDMATALGLVLDNMIRYAGAGGVSARITLRGLRIEAWDKGPGIAIDVQARLKDEPPKPENKDRGLERAKSMVDEMVVFSFPGNTQVIMERYLTTPTASRS